MDGITRTIDPIRNIIDTLKKNSADELWNIYQSIAIRSPLYFGD